MDSSHYSGGIPFYGDASSNASATAGRHPYPQQPQQPQSAFHTSLPNLSTAQQYEQTTLPPLQSQSRPPAGTSSSLYDHYTRPHQQQPGFPNSSQLNSSQLSSYGGPGAPFGGQFANYSHESLLPQQHQSYQMQHDPANSGYMGDLRNSGFSGLGSSLPPPLPSSQAYGAPFPGGYDQSPGHVVGAQGRRGILPSDDGRPSAVAADGTTSARTSIMPVKDNDGKYPCPHCNKSYLHAKHLKRHLLRHTGDRPYSCFLCNDTFSRSDILKRHFQKCSIRRGNPTGASHLQNSQTHLRKQAAKRSSNDLGKADTKSLPDSETTSINSVSTSRPASDNFSSIRSDGRTDSGISTRSSIISRDARSMTGPQPLTPMKSEQSSYGQPVNTALFPHSGQVMTYTGGSIGTHGYPPHEHAPLPISAPVPEAHNSMGYEWSGIRGPITPQTIDIAHPYYSTDGNVLGHQQSNCAFNQHGYSAWEVSSPQGEPFFNEVSNCLLSFLQIDDFADEKSNIIRGILSAENIEHFLIQYQNFHVHWPHVHLQTFDPLSSYAGLTLAMITIGAVYSERVDLKQVRVLMTYTKLHIRQHSDVGKAARDPDCDLGELFKNRHLYDQIVSLSLLTTLILWHADPEEREMLNSDHPELCNLLRRLGMLVLTPHGSSGYSQLHHQDSSGASGFDYGVWLCQEKRIRALYTTVLTDMGQFLYFNTKPNFTADEIQVPLPADDATWEAADGEQCAAALGLHGPEAQRAANASGSRRAKQLDFNRAMLKLSTGERFGQRSTNAFGRFLLVHGIHIKIWFAQHGSGVMSPPEPPTGSSRGESSADDIVQPTLPDLERELESWRQLSSEEDSLQYPPGGPPRLGFCRDGMTYFWLGIMLIRNSAHLDPKAHWQRRFRIMVQALKQAKAYSSNTSRADGSLLNLSADSIDPSYGIDDLTLDMKLLFTPLSPQGSPSVAEHLSTNIDPAIQSS